MQISIKPICDWPIYLTASADKRLACITQDFLSLHYIVYESISWHKIELLPTPFLHTPQGHLPFSSALFFTLQLNITFVFPVFIFIPVASNPDFYFISYHVHFLHFLPSRSSHLRTDVRQHHCLMSPPRERGHDNCYNLSGRLSVVSGYRQKSYMSRRNEVIINRLRIGHRRLTHSVTFLSVVRRRPT